MEDVIKGIKYLWTLMVLACAVLMIAYAAEGFMFGMFGYMVAEAACVGVIVRNKVTESRKSRRYR